MYDVVLNVIKSKNYELKDILTKIDTLWVQGSITEEQRLSLISEAQNNAKVENSIDILSKLYDLDRRVTALENKDKADEPTEGETEGDTGEVVTYPEYVPGNFYYNGAKVTVDGKNYKCIAPEGVVCVWSPSEYPAYWELYVEAPEGEPEVETEEETE